MTIKTLDPSPFKHMCMTIGGLPSSYMESMTYYEALTYLMNYLEKEVVPTVNNNSAVTKELQEYVTHYFDSLDVQEEINNKLDAMAESGQLQEIMAEYLDTKAIFAFDSVAELKAATNLKNGSFARTTGYYAKNDGGAGLYKIRTVTNQDVEDEGSIIRMADTTLVAELISTEANVDQFGAKGDGSTDDTERFSACLTYAINFGKPFTSNGGKIYCVSSTFEVSNLVLDFRKSTIKALTENSILEVNSQEYYTTIKNVTLDCNSIAREGILLQLARKTIITEVDMINVTGTGIKYVAGYEVTCEKVNISGNETSTNSIGLDLLSSDSNWTDITMIDMNVAIHTIHRMNYLTRIHAWILNWQILPNSKFISVDGKCYLYLNECYSDTYETTIYQENYGSDTGKKNPVILIDQLSVLFNQSIYSHAHHPVNPYVFRVQSAEDAQNIKLFNSFIQGNYAASITTGFLNHNPCLIYMEGNTLEHITATLDTSISITDSSFTPVTNKVTINGNVVEVNLCFSYDAGSVSQGTKKIGEINSILRPQTEIRTVAFVSDTQWGTSSYDTVLAVMDSSQLSVRIKSGTGTKYAFVNFTYVLNKQ